MDDTSQNHGNTPNSQIRDKFRELKWSKILRVIVLVLSLIFIFSGVRIIQPGEAGVLLRFGKLPSGISQAHTSGLLIAFPYPIDEVIRVPVESIKQISIDDYWQPETTETSSTTFHPLQQAYCLTGDYNVVLPRLIVKYRISDPVKYTLTVVDPEKMLRDVVGVELVRTIAEMQVDYILTEGKAELAAMVTSRSQERLDSLGVGLRIASIEINELIPPRSILQDFQDVQSAAIEKDTAVRDAETYYAQQIPQAEASATQILDQAQSYKVSVLALANAESNAFLALLAEYRLNPEVVKERLRNEYLARALSQAGQRVITPGPPVTGRILIPPPYNQ